MNKFVQACLDGRLRTFDGDRVESLVYFPTAMDYSYAGVVGGKLHAWYDAGAFRKDGSPCGMDLAICPRTIKLYVYRIGPGRYFTTQDPEAPNMLCGDRGKTRPAELVTTIEIEEP